MGGPAYLSGPSCSSSWLIVPVNCDELLRIRLAGRRKVTGGRGERPAWQISLSFTRLSCKRFVSNQVRLWLFVLAYNLGNFLRRLVLPGKIKHWSLRSLLVKLIKIGAKIVRHSRYITFQMAEVAISKSLFAEILFRIDRLRCYTA